MYNVCILVSYTNSIFSKKEKKKSIYGNKDKIRERHKSIQWDKNDGGFYIWRKIWFQYSTYSKRNSLSILNRNHCNYAFRFRWLSCNRWLCLIHTKYITIYGMFVQFRAQNCDFFPNYKISKWVSFLFCSVL